MKLGGLLVVLPSNAALCCLAACTLPAPPPALPPAHPSGPHLPGPGFQINQQDKQDNITASACADEVLYYQLMEVTDFRNDVILAEACRTDVDKYCRDVEPGACTFAPLRMLLYDTT